MSYDHREKLVKRVLAHSSGKASILSSNATKAGRRQYRSYAINTVMGDTARTRYALSNMIQRNSAQGQQPTLLGKFGDANLTTKLMGRKANTATSKGRCRIGKRGMMKLRERRTVRNLDQH